jgi:hypothetical protein
MIPANLLAIADQGHARARNTVLDPDHLTAFLASLPGRCEHGWHKSQGCPDCAPAAPVDDKASAYRLFCEALSAAVRADGTVHACDVRPLTRGRIAPRLLSRCWGQAINEHLLVEAGHERSNDVASRNSHRMEPYYELRAA